MIAMQSGLSVCLSVGRVTQTNIAPIDFICLHKNEYDSKVKPTLGRVC